VTSQPGSLAVIEQAARLLARANTIQEAKELQSLMLTAADWARRKGMGEEVVRRARAYAFEAERKLGQMLARTPRAKGAAAGGTKAGSRSNYTVLRDSVPTLRELGLSRRESAEAQRLAALPQENFEQARDGKKTKTAAYHDWIREKKAVELESIANRKVRVMQGVYDVVVTDPPWPVQKLERDCSPNQTKYLDYPTMSESKLLELKLPCAPNCHVWLWTTHGFLPLAMKMLEAWGLSYAYTFVWHKPGGMQLPGTPQLNCEFALYARRGHPTFFDTRSFPACFEAPRGRHSEKPEGFYDMVRRVTRGRRLDMFNRRPIEGFEVWGNESA